MRIILFLVAWLVALELTASESKSKRPINEVFHKAEAIKAIETASVVRMWRLQRLEQPADKGGPKGKPWAEKSEDEQSRDWAGQLRLQYESVGEGDELTAAQVSILRKMLLDPASYTGPRISEDGHQLYKSCGFWPNVRIEFSGAGEKIEIWICFSCSDLVALDEHRTVGGDEFKPVARDLLALVKSVLKDDPVIAKIRAR